MAAGVLEISAWNQANALRQVTVQRGLDVRDFALATFGGSGSLAVCRLLDMLGLPAAVVPRDPGNLSAFGLLTVDVRIDEVQTAVARHADLDPAAVAATLAALEARAAESLDAEGFARPSHRFLRSADLRYYGQAFEVRVPLPDGPVDPATHRGRRGRLPRRPRAPLRLLLPRRPHPAGRVGQPPRHRRRPHPPPHRCGRSGRASPSRPQTPTLSPGPGRSASTRRVDLSTRRSIAVTTWPRATWSTGRR